MRDCLEKTTTERSDKRKKFWNFTQIKDEEGNVSERILLLNGVISEDSWWGDEVTPAIFKEELNAEQSDITVWINSPGGDCFAAAQIFNMLREYPHNITVKIDALCASAATVVAMAGDTVLMSPVASFMIHDPSTIAWGNIKEMEKTIDILNEIKESILNAYELRTKLPRNKLAKLMEDETWLNANKAIEYGFVDGLLERAATDFGQPVMAAEFTPMMITNSIQSKLAVKETPKQPERTVQSCLDRLEIIKKYI